MTPQESAEKASSYNSNIPFAQTELAVELGTNSSDGRKISIAYKWFVEIFT